MLVTIPDLLSADIVMQFREQLAQGQWVDGRGTAGYLAAAQKKNVQLADTDPLAARLGNAILEILSQNARFISASLPLKILSPMFNAYAGEQEYGFHVDNSLRVDPQTGERIRADVSSTIFLSDPNEYDGGELVIQDTYGEQRVKLPAGHMVVYPSTSLHHGRHFMDPEHGARRHPAGPAVRHGQYHPAIGERAGRAQQRAVTVGDLSQPGAPLGGCISVGAA